VHDFVKNVTGASCLCGSSGSSQDAFGLEYRLAIARIHNHKRPTTERSRDGVIYIPITTALHYCPLKGPVHQALFVYVRRAE
jgi:hypothetical protein